MTAFHLQGFGAYTPAKKLTNADLLSMVDTNDEWIVSRTGIKARYMLADGEQGADAGAVAAQRALEDAGLPPGEITHVLAATCTPEYLCPSTACLISSKLGLQGPMAFDLNAACSGFVYGVELARGILLGTPDARVLLVSTEALTRRLDWANRSTCVLFGDGAGAAVLTSGDGTGSVGKLPARVEDVLCRADGAQASLLTVGGGTHSRYEPNEPVGGSFYIDMQGREVFKHAVRRLSAISREILERNGLGLDAVDLFIPHQANLRIIEAVGDRLDLHGDRVFVNVHDYGNTSAASIPLALADARRQGVIKPGMRVLLATFGGGFTWGAALLHF